MLTPTQCPPLHIVIIQYFVQDLGMFVVSHKLSHYEKRVEVHLRPKFVAAVRANDVQTALELCTVYKDIQMEEAMKNSYFETRLSDLRPFRRRRLLLRSSRERLRLDPLLRRLLRSDTEESLSEPDDSVSEPDSDSDDDSAFFLEGGGAFFFS